MNPLVRRWLGWRDRLLASPRFQHAAAAFALTRPIARREAAALFHLVAGFVYSQVLLACVRLDLFERLAPGPLSVAEIAQRIAMPEDSTRRLLDAAVALRLLQRRGDEHTERYGLGPLGAALRGNPGVVAMIEHHGALYADLADPLTLLREHPHGATHLSSYWAYADPTAATQAPNANGHAAEGPSAERVSAYSALMAASQPLVSRQILDAYPLKQHRCLLDVGGGEGAFACAAAQAAPKLQLMVFDLPAVAERATARLASAGLAHRAKAYGGSFLHDALPQGADIISLVRVVHDHDDPAVLTLLRAARAALPPGGTLLLAEPLAHTRGAQAMGDAYFGLYLLAMRQGRPRSFEELSGLLSQAGFEGVRRVPTDLPLQASVVVGRVAG